MPLDVTFQPVMNHLFGAERPGEVRDMSWSEEKKSKFSGKVKWPPKGLFAVDLWQMLDNKSMFEALARLDSFIALSDPWEGQSLKK